MTGPEAPGPVGDRGARRSRSRAARTVTTKVTTAVGAGKQRVEGTPAADLVSQLHSADLINGAMNFAALVLMIFFPFVITVASLSPLNHGGAASVIVQRMGLSPQAAADVEQLFKAEGGDVVVNGWTFMGLVWLVVGGVSLAGALYAIYRQVWALPSAGWRGFGAQASWLALLLVCAAAQMGLGTVLTGNLVGQLFFGMLAFLLLVGFFWAGARLLTLGRLSWPQLRPTAIFTAIGLTGLGVVSRVVFSASIVSNDKIYGSIGVVFIMLSWLIGIGVVITGGAIVGAWYVGANLSIRARGTAGARRRRRHPCGRPGPPTRRSRQRPRPHLVKRRSTAVADRSRPAVRQQTGAHVSAAEDGFPGAPAVGTSPAARAALFAGAWSIPRSVRPVTASMCPASGKEK